MYRVLYVITIYIMEIDFFRLAISLNNVFKIVQCILSKFMGGGELSEHCRQWQFTLRWFCYFVKISISWWLTIYLRYRTHFTLHSFISSECTTWCQFILKKPVKVPRMVSIFTSRTARMVVHIPFYILNTCIYPLIMVCGFIEDLYGCII